MCSSRRPYRGYECLRSCTQEGAHPAADREPLVPVAWSGPHAKTLGRTAAPATSTADSLSIGCAHNDGLTLGSWAEPDTEGLLRDPMMDAG